MTPDLEHLFFTPRLSIGRMEQPVQSHVDALNNKEHMRYSNQRHVTHTMESQKEFVELQDENFLVLEIKAKQNAHYISVGSLTANLDHHNLVANIGLMILPEHTKHGYGTEAWDALIFHLFKKGFGKIEAGTPEDNEAMLKIFKNSGMRPEGRRVRSFTLDNHRISDILLYGKLSHEPST